VSREDVDAFLDQCDDVLTDWDERWSPDAATWSADGSHEKEEVAWTNLGWVETVSDGAFDGALNGARLMFVVIDEAWTIQSEQVARQLAAYRDAAPVWEAFAVSARRIGAALNAAAGLWDAERQEPRVEGPPDPPHGLEAQRSPYGPHRRRRGR
jgi:hypothetical protein